jgi:hypothetical protein
MRKLENAQSVAGPQNELVKRRKRSGILTGYGLEFRKAMAGMVNAYLLGRSSGRKLYSSNKTIKPWMAVRLERLSRVACAPSTTPDFS